MEHHPGGHGTRRSRQARTEPRPRRYVARALVALVTAGAATLSGLALAPRDVKAEPTLETPATGTVIISRSQGRIASATINDSEADRDNTQADNAYYGTVTGAGPYDPADPKQSSVAHRVGYTPPWLDAADPDYWSYLARGVPSGYAANPGAFAGQYNPDAVSPAATNALGYRPNNPGNVALGQVFLLGTLRHNNAQVDSPNRWVHSWIDVRIGDLEDSFPFDQEETDNDTDTTSVARMGGPYVLHARAQEGNSCPAEAPYAALNRNNGVSVWYCYKHVGQGAGNRDIYTNDTTYPDPAGAPDQSPNSDDTLTFARTLSNRTITVEGIPYRLVIYGVAPSADGACPASPPADTPRIAVFSSKENRTSYGCLYASFNQERYMRISQTVTEDSAAFGNKIPPFNFTTLGIGDWTSPTGNPLPGSENPSGFIDWSSFSDSPLTPSGYGTNGRALSGYQAFIPGYSQFVVAETGPRIPGRRPPRFGEPGYFGPWKMSDDPNSARWQLIDVACVNGVGERVNAARDPVTGGIDFSSVPPARTPAAVPITCHFTVQQQAPKLRIDKTVESIEGAFTDDMTITYRVSATNDGNIAGTTGRLVDTPAFAPGLTLRSAAIASTLEDLGSAGEQARAASYVLTQGATVEAGASATWFIRMRVARDKTAPGYADTLLECPSRNGRLTPKRGLFNSVTGPYDYDGVANNEACAPARARTIRIEKAGTQPVGTPNEDGTYPLQGAAFAIYDNEALAGAPVSAHEGGHSFVTGPLEVGKTYWLVETRAPAGHALLPRPVPLRIAVASDASATTLIATDFGADEGFSSVRVLPAAMGASGEAALPVIRIVDTQVGVLPLSGSTGIYLYLVSGGALVAFAGAYQWTRRRHDT